jgi:membrane peptidoglycan carboxypeptidase
MVQGYATLADNGVYKPLVTIEEIKDARGKVIYAPSHASAPTRVLDERIAQDITSILSTPENRPAGWWRAQMQLPGGMQAAMKTGTSNLCLRRTSGGNCVSYGVNNVWAMGYTPDLVVGVWIGNADNAGLQPKADGLNVAIPLWKDFVVAAQEIRPGTLAFNLDKRTKTPAKQLRIDGIARQGTGGGEGDKAPSWLSDVMKQIAERTSRNKNR